MGNGRPNVLHMNCIGKARFATWTAAERVRKRRGINKHKRDDARQVYRCLVCRGFHLGERNVR